MVKAASVLTKDGRAMARHEFRWTGYHLARHRGTLVNGVERPSIEPFLTKSHSSERDIVEWYVRSM